MILALAGPSTLLTLELFHFFFFKQWSMNISKTHNLSNNDVHSHSNNGENLILILILN